MCFRVWALDSSGRRIDEVKQNQTEGGRSFPLEVFHGDKAVFAYEPAAE